MARQGIGFEHVINAANALVRNGENPTIQRIRAEIGSGSPNTIHRHLTAWRATQAPVARPAVKLPDSIATALADEIERQASVARAEAVSTALEEAAGVADERAETLAAERDAAQSDAGRLREELRLVQQRSGGDKTRQELVEAQKKVAALEEQLAEACSARADAETSAKAADSSRIAAELSAAVADARRDAAVSLAAERGRMLAAEQQARRQGAEQHREDLAGLRAEWSGRFEAQQWGTKLPRVQQ